MDWFCCEEDRCKKKAVVVVVVVVMMIGRCDGVFGSDGNVVTKERGCGMRRG